MRYREYVLAPLILLAAACAPLTAQLDTVTGTTLAERCVNYRTSLATLDAIRANRDLTESEANRRLAYQAIIDGACPPLQPEVQ